MSERWMVRGAEIACNATSVPEGLTVVWAHPGNGSRAQDNVVSPLRRVAFERAELIRYDARGHGDSEVTTGPDDYHWDALARDQLVLTQSLGVDRYVAAGASLGAVTGLWAAVQARDRVQALVLVQLPTAWEQRDGLADMYLELADLVEDEGTQALLARTDGRPVPDPLSERPDFVSRMRDFVANDDPERLAAVLRGTVGANYPDRDTLISLDVPTLVLAWTGDPVHPVSAAEEVASLIPNAQLTVSSTWAEVEAWTPQIDQFIASL